MSDQYKVVVLWRNVAKMFVASQAASFVLCLWLHKAGAHWSLGIPVGIICVCISACIWDTYGIERAPDA